MDGRASRGLQTPKSAILTPPLRFSRMLPGLMSRWMSRTHSCRYSSPSMTCLPMAPRTETGILLLGALRIRSSIDPASMNSMTILNVSPCSLVCSKKTPRHATTLWWLSDSIVSISCSIILDFSTSSLLLCDSVMTLSARMSFDTLSWTLKTVPLTPLPSMVQSLILTRSSSRTRRLASAEERLVCCGGGCHESRATEERVRCSTVEAVESRRADGAAGDGKRKPLDPASVLSRRKGKRFLGQSPMGFDREVSLPGPVDLWPFSWKVDHRLPSASPSAFEKCLSSARVKGLSNKPLTARGNPLGALSPSLDPKGL
mmetsp:Transcript_46981/g.124971  ORF Transcript_46981/g.124971 Transcript_46981/m.124971 type:complete len:315 (+) Transcript_46981:520-1464(+)